jgi:hypothetical protein
MMTVSLESIRHAVCSVPHQSSRPAAHACNRLYAGRQTDSRSADIVDSCRHDDGAVRLVLGPALNLIKRRNHMNAMKALGMVLILGGILALAYGGFTYTKETHETKIGPVVISVKDKETVNVPMWAGVGAIVLGGLLLVSGNKRS